MRTLLPTPVSVPVTKRPRTPSGAGARPRADPCRALDVERRRTAGLEVEGGAPAAGATGPSSLEAPGQRRHLDRGGAPSSQDSMLELVQRPGHAGGVESELRATREDARGLAELLGGVGGHHRQAQPRGSRGDRRGPDRLGEHAELERRLAERSARAPRPRRAGRSAPRRRAPGSPRGRARARSAGVARAAGARAGPLARAAPARPARRPARAAPVRSRRSASGRC